MGFVAATFLRLNNIGMVERRAAVIAADEAGDEEQIIGRLYDLQQYVSSHMNTDMGQGVYLEQSYKRDSQRMLDEASNEKNPNGNIYKKVQEICEPRFSGWSLAYVQCTADELAKYPAATNLLNDAKLPSTSSYVHVFASPLWSADFAGWSLVICAVLAILIVVRLIGLVILKLLLRRHYQSI